MDTYKAIVHEPSSVNPLVIGASSKVQLKSNIKLRINALVHEVRNSFFISLLAVWPLLFMIAATIQLWPLGLLFLLPLLIIYIKCTPRKLNPLARTYYYWRCLKMWDVELARRNAPEEQDWYNR
jgi:hypothetical protein